MAEYKYDPRCKDTLGDSALDFAKVFTGEGQADVRAWAKRLESPCSVFLRITIPHMCLCNSRGLYSSIHRSEINCPMLHDLVVLGYGNRIGI